MMRVAAIDIGTNSVHLIIADVGPHGQLDIIHKDRSQVMLGAGGLSHKRIAEDAFERGVAAMLQFKDACDHHGVIDIHTAATSAVREASNGDAFCKAVKAATGIHVKVIAGAEEARLIYLGARQALDFSRGRVMIFDLGGGSTEFILAEPERMVLPMSLPLGHIRLAEGFHPPGPLLPEARAAIRAHAKKVMSPLVQRVPKENVGSLVGTSGTIRCLARMASAARGDELPAHEHGLVLHRKELDALLKRFRALSPEELDTLPGMDPKRRRTLPAGAVLVREVMRVFGCTQLTTSELSLRDGLLMDWVLEHGPQVTLQSEFSDPRHRSVVHTMRRFDVDDDHAEQVAKLSLTLFDELSTLHMLPIGDRELLEHAARLHDIGHHISGKDHPKHAQYLLQHIKLFGFTAPEVAILSNLVRYHAGGTPKRKHPAFRALSGSDQRRVRMLAGMLRIADALDRSHTQVVERLSVQVTSEAIHLTAWCREGGDLERWAAGRRTPLLANNLGLRIDVHTQHGAAP